MGSLPENEDDMKNEHRLLSQLFSRSMLVILATYVAIAPPHGLLGAERPEETASVASAAASDLSEKAEILNSPEWRRAIFELGQWFETQQIYPPKRVAELKRDFNSRVAGMSAYELRYLLDDLNEKIAVMDSPEAREARAWVGQYLSTISGGRRSKLLASTPDITKMSAAQLAHEISRLETTRQNLVSQQANFNQSRDQLVQAQQSSIRATQQAVAAASRTSGGNYSPYRSSGSGGKTPFSNIQTGGSVHVGVGPFGAYVSF